MPPSPATGFRAGARQLGQPDFARLAAARFISAFGTAMAPLAMAFAVLDLTGSPRRVGLVIASQTAAQVAVQLFGGVVADRFSRRWIMVGADLLAAASQTTIALLLLFAGTPHIPLLAVLMAVNGVAFALFWPAATGLVPQVVARGDLQPANALLSLAQSSALGLGGACAGILVATVGPGWAIAADAATFLASAALVAGLRPNAEPRLAPASLWREIHEGWREFTAHRWLWAIVVQFALVMAAWNGGFLVVGPVVAARSLGGPAAWGLVSGAFGAGLVAGGLLGLRLQVVRPMLTATLCVFSFALPLLLLAWPAPVGWLSAGAFVAGAGGQLFGVLWNTALHTHVAPSALSRVSAYDALGSFALAPLGEAAAGPLIEGVGARATLWIAVGLIWLPTAAVLGVREVRTLEAPAAPPAR